MGQAVSLFGGEITNVAVPYQVYTLTHSSLAVGILGLLAIIPILTLSFVGGALADAHARRRLVLLTELGLMVLSCILVGNALLPHPHLSVLYGSDVGSVALGSLQRPALNALLPRLVERHELTAAGALDELYWTVATIIGPALAGILLAAIGLPITYAIDALTFLVSLVALRAMRAVPPPEAGVRPGLRSVLEGLRYARSRPDLLGTYLVDMVAMFFGMPRALFPALATHYGGVSVLGLLYAAPSVGAFVATLTSGWANHVHRHGVAIILAAGGWGLAIIGFGLSPSLPLALFFLALAGAADTISGLFRGTIWNSTIPDTLRGRLAGIELVSYSTGPALGNVEAGAVAAAFGLRTSVVSGGILCVLGTALLAVFLPGFRRYDARVYAQTSRETPA
jgi:MFS family permease